MPYRLLAVFLLGSLMLAAAQKPLAVSTKGENEDLILRVTLHMDPAGIKELVGSDLGGHYFVAEVTVEPKYGKEVVIDLDDFVLRTNKDGEHTQPYVASQVAGRNSMVVSDTENAKTSHTYIGMGGGDVIPHQAAVKVVKVESDDSETPLEKTLDQKILPQRKTEAPVSGLLYFPMEKQKMKDLELLYGGKENRITLRFR